MNYIASMFPTLLATAGQPTEEEVLAILALLMVVLVMVVISFAISIIVAAMLYVIQKRVPAEHRKMEPLLVWLLLIPLFNLVWNFFVFQRISQSYQSYFQAQGRTEVGDCGKAIGLWYAICVVVAMVPCVGYVAGPAALVLLIIYLVKMFGLRGQIPLTAATV